MAGGRVWYPWRGAGVGEDVCVWYEFIEDASGSKCHAFVVRLWDFDTVGHASYFLDTAWVQEVEGFGQADLVIEDELNFAACGFCACGGGRALEDAQLDVAFYGKVFVQWEDGCADRVGGDIAGDGRRGDAALAVENDVHISFAERREDAEGDQPPTYTLLPALQWYLMSDDAATCSKTFGAACDEAGSVDERSTRHAELNLRPVCNRVQQPDEVCFMAVQTGVGRGRADLRYAHGSAGKCCEDKT